MNTPKLRLEVDGDQVTVTGPREVVAGAMDLHLLNYVEQDGFIRVVVPDPIPYRGRMMANGAIRGARFSPQTLDALTP